MKGRRSLCLILIFVLVFSCFATVSVFAAEKPVKSKYLGIQSNGPAGTATVQYKVYEYTYEARWTPQKVLKGQPKGGYYLEKGDALFYVDCDSGISASVAYAGLSVNVPLGKVGNKKIGVAKTAKKNGYYVLQCKKYVNPTEKHAVAYRTRTAYYMPWSSWKTCDKTLSKGYVVNKVNASLKKVN